jgi:hypothetical protein
MELTESGSPDGNVVNPVDFNEADVSIRFPIIHRKNYDCANRIWKEDPRYAAVMFISGKVPDR